MDTSVSVVQLAKTKALMLAFSQTYFQIEPQKQWTVTVRTFM